MDNTPDILVTITPLVEVLEELGVPYHIGGSVASSLYGLPRLTIDVDIVADLRQGHVRPLIINSSGTGWVAKYQIDNGTISSVYSKFRALISIWRISKNGRQI